jgi:2-keto-4-pentenoate hydratase
MTGAIRALAVGEGSGVTATAASADDLERRAAIARRFVEARRRGEALAAFPDVIPPSLDEAYAIQDIAIGLWDDEVAGWKVGRIAPQIAREVGADHLAGPIFARAVWAAGPQPTPAPAIPGGFCAVEAEFVFRLGADAPPVRMNWTADDAAGLVAAMHIGMEIAGSPLPVINDLGPRVVAADFGNNTGLILGPAVEGWAGRDPAALPSETFVDGASVGRGSAAALLGGPLGSLVFILEHLARRGRPARAGQLIATGQTTGIHDLAAGQGARCVFAGLGEIACVGQSART